MNKTFFTLFIIALAFLGLNSLFTMNERQQGLVLQFMILIKTQKMLLGKEFILKH